jgi:hypothetical protein
VPYSNAAGNETHGGHVGMAGAGAGAGAGGYYAAPSQGAYEGGRSHDNQQHYANMSMNDYPQFHGVGPHLGNNSFHTQQSQQPQQQPPPQHQPLWSQQNSNSHPNNRR